MAHISLQFRRWMPIAAWWRRLPAQMIVVFVVPLTLALSAVAFLSVSWHEQAMRDLIRARDERAIQLAAGDLSARFEMHRVTLALIQEHLDAGLTLADLAAEEPLLVEMFDRGLVQTGSRGERLAVWPADSACPSGDSSVIVLEIPALTGCVSLAKLGVFQIAAQLHTDHAVSVYLVDDQGRARFRTDGAAPEDPLPDRLHIQAAMAGPAGSHEIDSGGMVVAYSPVPGVGWAIIMAEPWHEIASTRLRLSQFAPLTVLPIALIGVLVMAFGTLRVVRPLQRLRQQAARLGDLNALQTPVGGIQEITDLQHTLVDMASRLQHAQATLRDYIGAITRAQEDERFRLARDLHDDTVQALIALNQRVQMVQRALRRDPDLADQRLRELRDMADQIIMDVRRMIQDVRPTYLSDLGLVAALRALVQHAASTDLEAAFEVEGEPRRLDDDMELGLYRIAQEAVNNTTKHARARHLTVKLAFAPDAVCLTVQDDGQGFVVPDNLLSLVNSGSYGLVGISERAQLANGALSLVSGEQRGTTLSVRVPLS
jgi:signal transduction histidine kinase